MKNRWSRPLLALGTVAACIGLVACGQAPSGSTGSNANSTSATHSNKTGSANGSNTARSNSAGATTKPVAVPKGPLPGDLLIADRGNDRLLIVNPQKKVLWQMTINPGGVFGVNSLGPDDSFITPDHKHIIINEENNNVIALIDIKTKKIVWTYGHPGVAGSQPGYLNTPDDAYMLPNGLVSVADIKNQRILFINPKTNQIVKQYGITGYRYHNPPKSFEAPNGDTPLPNGGTLVTEIGSGYTGQGYADYINPNGTMRYSVNLPLVAYPSDTQLLPNGNLLVADYSTPGRVIEVTPQGKVVFNYYKTSGPAALNSPSLAMPLPNGDIVLNDDFNDRVVIIDPKTGKIVWQYGVKGVASSKTGYLNDPDGLDFIPLSWHVPI